MSARSRKILVETVLTVGALAGVLCVVVAIVSVAFGLSPLVVRSGSMSPTIATGDIAIARSVPANDVRIGDIVSVTRPDGTRVTHRVTTIDARVGKITTTVGANSVTATQKATQLTVDTPGVSGALAARLETTAQIPGAPERTSEQLVALLPIPDGAVLVSVNNLTGQPDESVFRQVVTAAAKKISG